MEMNVILGSSANYLPYTAVAVASVCRHMAAGDRAVFHVMHAGDVREPEMGRFRTNLRRFADRAAITFVAVPDSLGLAERIRTSPHIGGAATYLRMYIPDLFQGRTAKAVYLDSDLVVRRDLAELFSVDMRGMSLGGVEDMLSWSHLGSLGLPETGGYVNAGVLVYDLDSIDREKIRAGLEKILNARRKYALTAGDQDLLALLFHDSTHYLPALWNVMAKNSFIGRSFIWKRCRRQNGHSLGDTFAALADPGIIHYIGPAKPWHRTWYYDPLAPRWFEYARLTGYYGDEWAKLDRHVAAVAAADRVGTALCRPFSRILGKAYRFISSPPLGDAVRRARERVSLRGPANRKNALLLANAGKRTQACFSPDAVSMTPYRRIGLLNAAAFDPEKDIDETGRLDFFRVLFASPFLQSAAGGGLETADSLLMHFFGGSGHARAMTRMLERSIEGGIPLHFVEDGPVAGILDSCSCRAVPLRFRRAYSFAVDDLAFNFDSVVQSRAWRRLRGGARPVDGAARARCAGAIDYILKNRLTRYNFLPRESGERFPGGRKILVVDQRLGDPAVVRGGAGPETFVHMLEAALSENPGAAIYISQSPSMHMAEGCLRRKTGDRIRRLSRPINPYELFALMDKVYTVNSWLGFEALLAGVPVAAFGRSIYANLGLTEDRNGAGREGRVEREDLFHALFLDQNLYFSPVSFERIELEAFLAEMAGLRDEFGDWMRKGRLRPCPPVRGLPEAVDCPVCQGRMALSLISRGRAANGSDNGGR